MVPASASPEIDSSTENTFLEDGTRSETWEVRWENPAVGLRIVTVKIADHYEREATTIPRFIFVGPKDRKVYYNILLDQISPLHSIIVSADTDCPGVEIQYSDLTSAHWESLGKILLISRPWYCRYFTTGQLLVGWTSDTWPVADVIPCPGKLTPDAPQYFLRTRKLGWNETLEAAASGSDSEYTEAEHQALERART